MLPRVSLTMPDAGGENQQVIMPRINHAMLAPREIEVLQIIPRHQFGVRRCGDIDAAAAQAPGDGAKDGLVKMKLQGHRGPLASRPISRDIES
jgi:hypothetical protein